MKKYLTIIIFFLAPGICIGQPFDTSQYRIKMEDPGNTDKYFTNDLMWRGADGAASIDLENGKVLWLFSDGFISSDSSGSRKRSVIIRNSVAIQDGYDLKTAPVRFYWNTSKKKPQAFFQTRGKSWFWTGHGIMVKDRLLIFLIREHEIKTGIGFEASGWDAVLVSNPHDEPSRWKMRYIRGCETFGTIAGSAAVLKDDEYLYAYGAVEPATHEVYLLRWKLTAAYNGNLANPEWWLNGRWAERKTKDPVPAPLFIGATEYSVHYDHALKKYIQVQSSGFGEGKIGIRMSDSLQGKWTDLYTVYTPVYDGIKKPFMYAARAHPELHADGIYITYNVNSFDFEELKENLGIYFPKFILVKIVKKDGRSF
ncbi:MAG: DUF4185 domain-containing protein [Chitinophagaceae bacterium]|nr:DUF4185 domain-containing protein [Chitinophagaceae bacterium]